MRTEEVTFYRADELEGEAFERAYNEYVEFNVNDIEEREALGQDVEGLVKEVSREQFIQTSNNNGYEYYKDGELV